MKNNKGFGGKILELLSGGKAPSGQVKAAAGQAELKKQGNKPVHKQQPLKSREIEKEDEDFVRLAGQCTMGDVESMMELADWFRSGFVPELEAVISAYEKNPDETNYKMLENYVNNCLKNRASLDAYIFWVGRAALYGNKRAGEMIKKYTYYDARAYSYLPRKLFSPGSREIEHYWSSDALHRFGLIEIPQGETDCHLCAINASGYFNFYYVSWYCPADEDGFGREEEYEDIYYDEFFKEISTRDVSKIRSELLKSGEERERYWQIPENNALTRKYKRSILADG